MVAGTARRKSRVRRYVFSGFSGGSHRMYFRKNAFTCMPMGQNTVSHDELCIEPRLEW